MSLANAPITWGDLVLTVIGIIAGFLLAVWYDTRKSREELVSAKSVKSRFEIGQLNKELAAQISVFYEVRKVKSITLFHLRVVNPSPKAIANQTFTVKFSDQADIIRQEFVASDEIERYIRRDASFATNTKSRYILGYLPRNSQVEFDFVVIDHTQRSFEIEPGVLAPDDPEATGGFQTTVDAKVSITEGSVINLLDVRIERALRYTMLFSFLGCSIYLAPPLFRMFCSLYYH